MKLKKKQLKKMFVARIIYYAQGDNFLTKQQKYFHLRVQTDIWKETTFYPVFTCFGDAGKYRFSVEKNLEKDYIL